MNPIEYIKSDSDNLFKFLFLNGVVFLILNIFYPMQKMNEINLKIIECNKTIDLLNFDIDKLNFEYKKFKKEIKESNSITNKLKYKERVVQKLIFEKKLSDQKRQEIVIENDKLVVKELDTQAKKYSSYYIILNIVSVIFIVIGLFGWVYTTIQQIKRNNLENDKLKRELP